MLFISCKKLEHLKCFPNHDMSRPPLASPGPVVPLVENSPKNIKSNEIPGTTGA
jgi:hypothetical protein